MNFHNRKIFFYNSLIFLKKIRISKGIHYGKNHHAWILYRSPFFELSNGFCERKVKRRKGEKKEEEEKRRKKGREEKRDREGYKATRERKRRDERSESETNEANETSTGTRTQTHR